jgi:hypothetical protein
MTTRILLEYPSASPVTRVLNDLTELARAEGPGGQQPAISIAGDDPTQVGYVKTRMAQIRKPLADYTPGGDLPDTDAIVSNADTLPLQTNGGTASSNVTATVAANAVSNVKLPASTALVGNAATVAVRNSAGADSHNGTSVTTTQGALTGINLAATVAMVDNSDSVPLLPSAGTTPAQGNGIAAVAAGVVTGVRLPATSAVVTNGQVINVTGGTVTLTVAANVVTAAYTAA